MIINSEVSAAGKPESNRNGGSKTYYPEIAVLRGIGIILVVLGHALKQTGEDGTAYEALISVIYSFHMPLFFVLSGFVSVKVLNLSGRQDRLTYVKNRAGRLLIPYMVMSVLYLPLKLMLSRYALKPYRLADSWRILIGDSPNTAVWYIYILFWVSILCACLVTEKTISLFLGISFVIAVAAWRMDIVWKLPKYSFFFILGLFVRMHYDVVQKYMRRKSYLVPAAALFITANLLLWRKGWTEVTMVTALSGIFLCFGLADLLQHAGADRPFRFLGEMSMDIYIFSEPVITVVKLVFWNMLHLGAGTVTLLCFCAGLLLPVPASKYIVRKVKLFRILFLGV